MKSQTQPFEPSGLSTNERSPSLVGRVCKRLPLMALGFLFALSLTACGQKGPLYLPSQKPTSMLQTLKPLSLLQSAHRTPLVQPFSA